MVLFLTILGIIIAICFFIILLCMMTINIEIEQLSINNIESADIKINYRFIIKLYILNKIRIFNITIDKEKIKNAKIIKKLSKFKLVKDKNTLSLKTKSREIKLDKRIFKALKEIKFDILKLELDATIGTEDAVITSFIICFLSVITSIILGKNIKRVNIKKCRYQITPVYQNKNLVKINLNCIINLNLVHIMNIIYIYLKQGSVKKNERTSNRRSYDYCDEQYTRYGRRKYNYRRTN